MGIFLRNGRLVFSQMYKRSVPDSEENTIKFFLR